MNYFVFNFFFIVFCFIVNYSFPQTPLTDSLIRLIPVTQSDSQKVVLYGDIAWEFLSVDISKSQFYAEEELDLAMDIKNDVLIAQAESDVGNVLNRKGSFDSAIVHYLKAVELRQKLNQPLKEAGIYINMATALHQQNKFKEAIDFNFKSLKIFEEANDKQKQACILGNIGNIYYQLEQNTQAYTYFQRGLIIAKESGNPNYIASSLSNMGGIKFEIQEYDSALFYYFAAEKTLTENNLFYSLGATYNNIGKTLAAKNEYAKAIEYYKKGLENRIQFEDEYGFALSNLNIGSLYVTQKDYSRALDYLKKSEPIFLKNHAFIGLKDCYLQMASASELSGDLNTAIAYYKLYSNYKDSVYTKESYEQSLELNAKYEAEKQEQQIIILNKEKLHRLAELNKQKVIIWAVVGGMLLMAIIVVFILRSLQLSNRQKKYLATIKELEHQNAMEKERLRISRDLHDELGAGLSLILLNSSMAQSQSNQSDAVDSFLIRINRNTKELYESMNNLIWLLKTENQTLNSLLSKLRETISELCDDSGLECNINLPDTDLEYPIHRDTSRQIYLLVKESVNNVIKHASATELTFNMEISNEKMTIWVIDDGKGFAIKDFESKGNGLHNLKLRAEHLEGDLIIQSELGRGTQVKIQIPTKSLSVVEFGNTTIG